MTLTQRVPKVILYPLCHGFYQSSHYYRFFRCHCDAQNRLIWQNLWHRGYSITLGTLCVSVMCQGWQWKDTGTINIHTKWIEQAKIVSKEQHQMIHAFLAKSFCIVSKHCMFILRQIVGLLDPDFLHAWLSQGPHTPKSLTFLQLYYGCEFPFTCKRF